MDKFYPPVQFRKAVSIAADTLRRFRGKRVFIYGTGKHTEALIREIGGNLIESVAGIFAPSPVGQTPPRIQGLPVFSAEEIPFLNVDAIIISSQTFQNEIYIRLKLANFEGCELITLYETESYDDLISKDRVLLLETTDFCNLQCSFCPSQNQGPQAHINKDKSFLGMEQFKKYVDGLVARGERFQSVSLFWVGEPFLHKNCIEMIDYLLGHPENFNEVRVDSNFIAVTRKQIDRLLSVARKGLKLTLALDATTQSVYEKIRIKGKLHLARQNVEYLIQRRQELGLQFPKLNFQFILQEANRHQLLDFVNYWSGMVEDSGHTVPGDKISITRLVSLNEGSGAHHPQNNLYDEVISNSGLLDFHPRHIDIEIFRDPTWGQSGAGTDDTDREEGASGARPKICPSLWKTPVISADGRVTACCADINLQLQTGDLEREDFSQAWNRGEKINYLRLLHLLGLADTLDICRHCEGYNWTQINQEEIAGYLQSLDPGILEKVLARIQEEFDLVIPGRLLPAT